MIVRISTEGQYRLESAGELNDLDNAVVAASESGDDDAFRVAYSALLNYVRSHGTPLADDELIGSDAILPRPDVGLAEAMADFSGEGLIPD